MIIEITEGRASTRLTKWPSGSRPLWKQLPSRAFTGVAALRVRRDRRVHSRGV